MYKAIAAFWSIAALPYCRIIVTLPNCRIVVLPHYCHIAELPHCPIAALLPHCRIIPNCRIIAISPYCRIILNCRIIATSPHYWRIAVLSNPKFHCLIYQYRLEYLLAHESARCVNRATRSMSAEEL